MKKILYSFLALSVLIFSACRKKNEPVPNKPIDLLRDSIFLYAKEAYLWHSSLPNYATFAPRSSKYTAGSDINTLTNELNALSQIAINPANNIPYEYYDTEGDAKYSFIDDGAVSGELNGTKGDFGFAPFYNTISDLRVKYVYPGSPADLAGIRRGDQITSINGSTSLSYDGPEYGNSNNLNFVINAYSNSNTISMILSRPGVSAPLTVNNMAVANYTVNPVLKTAIFTISSSKKVGYIVFNSFTSGANAIPQLNTAFNDFVAKGITDLVVDLRYNGGGYVSTAEYLDNLIVPTAKNGSLMYNTYYNDILASGNAVLLKNQWRKDVASGQVYNYGQFDYSVAGNEVYFAKTGSLNVNSDLKHVFFIITGSTASASELTINNLRPVMDVQLIGQTSYGKPVGFFDIDINKYQMYIPEFSVKNSLDQGDYYQGFTPGTTGYPGVEAHDDVTKDFGDPTEGLLAQALTYVTNGAYATVPSSSILTSRFGAFSARVQNDIAIRMNLKQHVFNGMIYDKKLKLKKK